MKKVILNIPDNIRIGQYIFNLLEFIRLEKDPDNDNYKVWTESFIDSQFKTTDRLYDTFYMDDKELKNLIKKYETR